MIRYVIKRLVLLIPVLIGVTFIIFALMSLAPGNPGVAILGASAAPEAIEAFNESVGYYDPFFVRYFDYILDLFRFDLGTSYRSGEAVLVEIAARFPATIAVATFSMLFAVLVGVPLGVLSAVKQYSWMDNIARVLSISLAAVPFFWLGLMFIYWFGMKLHWFPTFGADTWKHYVMPCVALGIPYAARQLRMTRSCMLETIRQGYVRTARAKGAGEKQVIWRHAFKNALISIITLIGMQFGALLGGAIVTEAVFSMPGLGSYMINGIKGKDIPVVLSSVVVMAVSFCLVMLAVDLIYAFIDPRIKSKYAKKKR